MTEHFFITFLHRADKQSHKHSLLIKRTDSTERFDAAAETWDDNPLRVMLARQVMQSMQDSIPFQTSWNVLEIGCGTGLLSCPVARKTAKLTTIDTSQGMIDELKKKLREDKSSNIRPVVLDILSPSLSPELAKLYDLVFSSMTFHHIEEVDKALQKIHTLVRPGGYLAIADLDEEDGFFHDSDDERVHHGFRRDLFEKLLMHAGFIDISFSTAATFNKINRAGNERSYSIFLATARKSNEQ